MQFIKKAALVFMLFQLITTWTMASEFKKSDLKACRLLIKVTRLTRNNRMKEAKKYFAITNEDYPQAFNSWRANELIKDVKQEYQIYRVEYYDHKNKMQITRSPVEWEKIKKIYSITIMLKNNKKPTICFNDDRTKIVKYYIKCCDRRANDR